MVEKVGLIELFKNFWKKQDYHVKVLIVCVLITYSAMSVYTPWYFIRYGYKIGIFNILFVIPYSITFYIISKKRLLAAKVWFYIVYFFHVFIISILFFETGTGYHYYHLSLVPISFILFSPDEWKSRMTLNYLNILAFIFSTFYDVNLFHIIMSDTEQFLLFYTALVFNIAGITATLFVFSYELMNAEKKLKFLASHDQLTSLLNRRSFVDFADYELKRFRRGGRVFSIVLIDLDFFKKINDSYGHCAGDLVLKSFSTLLKNNLRDTDIISRFGGEEFICLMPDTTSKDASLILDRIREKKGNFKVSYKTAVIEYSFSAGIFSPDETDNEELVFDSVIDKADNALYQAKKTGRGRICISH